MFIYSRSIVYIYFKLNSCYGFVEYLQILNMILNWYRYLCITKPHFIYFYDSHYVTLIQTKQKYDSKLCFI